VQELFGLPVPIAAGMLFYLLWVPIVLIAAALTWSRNRLGLMLPISADAGDWKKAVVYLLLVGIPVAVGFGVLFALRSTAVLVGVVAVVVIILVFGLLPRLNRWW
jgi:hypothetical protein